MDSMKKVFTFIIEISFLSKKFLWSYVPTCRVFSVINTRIFIFRHWWQPNSVWHNLCWSWTSKMDRKSSASPEQSLQQRKSWKEAFEDFGGFGNQYSTIKVGLLFIFDRELARKVLRVCQVFFHYFCWAVIHLVTLITTRWQLVYKKVNIQLT